MPKPLAGFATGDQLSLTGLPDATSASLVNGGSILRILTTSHGTVDLAVSGYATNMIAPAMPIMIQRKRTFLRCPAESLGLLGLSAETTEDVILTHLHYDHVGNAHKFPRARFHLQDKEMTYATGRHMRYPFFGGGFECDDVVGMVAPRYGAATVERIAINAVMAGCRPEYLPVLIAAVEAVATERFHLQAIQARQSRGPVPARCIAVHGDLQMNDKAIQIQL